MSKRKQGSRDVYNGPRVLRGTVAVGISPMREVLKWVAYDRILRRLLDEPIVDHDTQQCGEEEE